MQITLRMGAAHDDLTINGSTFDRSGLDRRQRGHLAGMVRDTWSQFHNIPTPKKRKRKSRKNG
ncbi:hypothetical protein [Roseibium alexandrii]|uniref:Uncharacterized protein n=1 Tax=Roseibium alexandrii (strain DSM 17067 / NCIMB 14079 / DFL-11) TaxID=244592 RepID=A0A5E8GTG5_ROSAD|nr:hypothetical protein [Roseibium alexandrii]EEE42841.1 hypothetical protein SADFL11_PLAS13 [Roseibium alexandrii DFL-11]